jgi:hypothetical protein
MMTSFAQFAINLILVVPLFAACCAIFMMVRAVVKGVVASGGGRFRVRTIYRSINPIQFWMEICLYFATAIFLLLLGLLLTSQIQIH